MQWSTVPKAELTLIEQEARYDQHLWRHRGQKEDYEGLIGVVSSEPRLMNKSFAFE